MDLQPDDEQAVWQCEETRLQSDRAKETDELVIHSSSGGRQQVFSAV